MELDKAPKYTEAYKTSDGKLFEYLHDAIMHENKLAAGGCDE